MLDIRDRMPINTIPGSDVIDTLSGSQLRSDSANIIVREPRRLPVQVVVLGRGHQLQMIRVNACSILAAVMNVHTCRNLAAVLSVERAMRLMSSMHRVSIRRQFALPNPARRFKSAILHHVHRAGILDRVMTTNIRDVLPRDSTTRPVSLFGNCGLLAASAETVPVRIRGWEIAAKSPLRTLPRAIGAVLHRRVEQRAAGRTFDPLFALPILSGAVPVRAQLAPFRLGVAPDLRAAIAAVSRRDSSSQLCSTRHAAGLAASIPGTRPLKVKHLAADLARQFNDGWGRILVHRLLQSTGATAGDVPPSPGHFHTLIIPHYAGRLGVL